jgi:hypothetical protein
MILQFLYVFEFPSSSGDFWRYLLNANGLNSDIDNPPLLKCNREIKVRRRLLNVI